MRIFEIDAFDDDRSALERYQRGECMVMAATLHDLHGGTLVGIFDDVWDTVPRHVGVMFGEDVFGDARGLRQSRDEFLADYLGADCGALRIEPLTLPRMKAIWGKRIKNWTVPSVDMQELGLT
jgi:hypothetical protein